MLGKVFVRVPCLILMVLCSSLTLTMFGREIRRCFVVSLLGVSGMGFFLVRMCLVGFAGVVTLMVIFSGIVLFHLLLRSVNILSFTILLSWIRLLGLGASFGMVGYPFSLALMVVLLGLKPLLRGAVNLLECALGRYSSGQLTEWQLPAGFDVDGAALRVADDPDVWTDGSLVDYRGSGVSSAGAGCFTFRNRRWSCLLWHGWLPMLSGVNGASPWAADASESAFYLVETALGRYSSRLLSEWSLPNGFDADEVSARMPDSSRVWSDGSMVLDSVAGISAAGAGMFAHQSEFCWIDRRWGHVDFVHSAGVDHSCRAFISVPGPLQTVQRAELWGVILALQASDAVHLGVDNFGSSSSCW